MHFLAQGVKVGPALGVQKAHLVLRAGHLNAVAVHQAGQALHVKVGAGIAPGHQFNGDLAPIDGN